MGELKEKIIQKFKFIVKNILKVITAKLIPIILVCLVVLIGISGFTYLITINDGTYDEGDWSNTGYVVLEMALSKATIENIQQCEDGWNIDIDLDQTVDDIIQKLKDKHGVLDKYISNKNVKEYLKTFIRAELITQYPDLRNADKIGTPVKSNEIQGCIQIQRALPEATNGETQIMTYIDYETFNSYITSGNSMATNYFSLDQNGNLIVAGWNRIITNINSNMPGVENVTDKIEYSLTTNSIDYKSLLKKYSMPFDFLWALTVMGADEDFAYNVAKLALDSKIIILVQDNLTTVTTNIYEEYDLQEKYDKNAVITATVDGISSSKSVEKVDEKTPVNYYTETIIKDANCRTNMDIIYADTWLMEYTNPYFNVIPSGNKNNESNEDIAEKEDTEYELKSNGVLNSDYAISQELYNYLIAKCGGIENYELKLLNGEVSGSISTIHYKKYERLLNQKTTTSITTNYNTYTQGTPSIEEKTDKNSTEDNFVTLFLAYDKASKNILSAPSWLFEMLEGSSKTSDMIDTVKYLLYKATGKDYGITELDLSVLKQKEFFSGGSAIAEWLKSYEYNDLRELRNGQITYEEFKTSGYHPDTVSLDENGKMLYHMYHIIVDTEDTKDNSWCFTFGIMIFPMSGGTIKATYNLDEIQKVGLSEAELKASINYTTKNPYYTDQGFDADMIDELFMQIIATHRKNINDYYKGKGIELKSNEIDALVAISWGHGNCYVNNETINLLQKYINDRENEANKEALINNFQLTDGFRPFKYRPWMKGTNSRGQNIQIMFFEGRYILSTGEEIFAGGDGIVGYAKIVHDYMSDPAHLYYYCLLGGSQHENEHRKEGLSCGLNKSFEESQKKGSYGYRLTCCATYVSWVLQEAGLIDVHNNGCPGLSDTLRKAGWIRIDNPSELEPGDIVFYRK